MLRPYRHNFNNSMQVVRHDHKFVQVHFCEVPRNRQPAFPDSLPKHTQLDVALMEGA